MNGPKEELVRSWLTKAFRDLLSARELADGETSLLDTAAYHCQQAAEKAVKGFLLYHDVRFEKTHDVESLVSQAMNIDRYFADCLDAARLLTPLAVEYRYPGDFVEPESDEFEEAYVHAQNLYLFVLARLPKKTHP